MRKLGLAITTVLVLFAASFVSPLAAPASGSAPIPIPPGHHAGARSPHLAAPAIGVRSPASVVFTPVCDGHFNVVASPNRTGNNLLESTAANAVNDVWSVGISNDSSTASQTLAEHWNGTTWSIVPTVNPGTRHNRLFSVSAVSSNNVWAVGEYDINAALLNDSATLAEHWNGTSWSKTTTQDPSVGADLFGVTAIDSSNVWAVGQQFNFGSGEWNTLIEFYNGTSWAVVPSADSSTSDYNELDTVSAFSSTDIWAVGFHAPVIDPQGDLGPFQALAEHWDGFTWTVVATPDMTGDNQIIGVNALEANHAVGVGYGGFVNNTSPEQGEAWDLQAGGGSTNVELSSSALGDNSFQAVARSSNSVWAVGYSSINSSLPLQDQVWQASWDPTTHALTWAASPGSAASPSSSFNLLVGVAAISPSVFWAVGIADTTVDQTLTELYCGLHFNLSVPPTAGASVPFALTVTAKNPNNSTDTAYRGTVHFTSSDSQAVLPGNYTFTPGDAGVHTFTGVVLKSPYNQPSTITVSDTVTPFITASASITVSCAGACPSSAGAPGGRGTAQAPAGSPGSRVGNQSPVVAPGPRVPRHLLAVYGGSPGHEGNLAIASLPERTRIGVQAQPGLTTVPTRTTVPARTTTGLALTQGGDEVLVSQRTIVSPRAADSAWNVGMAVPLGLLVIALLALRRPRRKERSNINVRP
jgi:hypothetical protein